MIEGIYFFGDQVRWNLGWPNPNPAGAFVAMCLVFLFAGHVCFRAPADRRWRFFGLALLLIESGLWFLLCKTYSRGALLAAVCGMLFYFLGLFFFRLQGLSRSRVCVGLLLRFALLACLLWITGFFGRIDPGFVAEDASVGNRAVLWQGGAQMLWHKPLTGWGVGESGPQFMHWFQPVDASAQYAGMVNSYHGAGRAEITLCHTIGDGCGDRRFSSLQYLQYPLDLSPPLDSGWACCRWHLNPRCARPGAWLSI